MDSMTALAVAKSISDPAAVLERLRRSVSGRTTEANRFVLTTLVERANSEYQFTTFEVDGLLERVARQAVCAQVLYVLDYVGFESDEARLAEIIQVLNPRHFATRSTSYTDAALHDVADEARAEIMEAIR